VSLLRKLFTGKEFNSKGTKAKRFLEEFANEEVSLEYFFS
jgi:hypothetical protein